MAMIRHPLASDGEFHMDDNLYNNIIEIKKRIQKNKDVLFLVGGDPGNGKSTICSQILYVLDPKTVENYSVHSTMESYTQHGVELGRKGISKGRGKMHDEGRETSSINVLKTKVKIFWDSIYENRFLNMYQAIIQSDFWKTPKDVVFNRALFLIWVLEDKKWNNGVYYFYGKEDMKKLYDRGKKFNNRRPIGNSFKGRFIDFWAGHPDYLTRKASSYFDKYSNEYQPSRLTIKQVVKFILERNPEVQPGLLAKMLLMDRSYFFDIRKEINDG